MAAGDGTDNTGSTPALPDLPDTGADPNATFEKRQQLRDMLLALGLDLPASLTDLTATSTKLADLQKKSTQAIKDLMAAGIGLNHDNLSEKLANLVALQDQLKNVGDLFQGYATDYFNKQSGADKSSMTAAQAKKYLDPAGFKSWLDEQGFTGDRAAAELADYGAAKDAANAKLTDMTQTQAQTYLSREDYAKWLTSQNIAGDRYNAELMDYDKQNQSLTEPTKTQAAKYMDRNAYAAYLTNTLHYSGARLDVELKDFDAAKAGNTQVGDGTAPKSDNGAAARAESQAKLDAAYHGGSAQAFNKAMAQAAPSAVRLPTSQEFMSDFGNAFDAALGGIGTRPNTPGGGDIGGGITNELDFARRVMQPALMSQYMGELAKQAQPYQASEAEYGVAGQGTSAVSGADLAKYGINRSSVALPTLMPADFLKQHLTAEKIKMAYEGSSRGAGQYRSAGTGTTVAQRV